MLKGFLQSDEAGGTHGIPQDASVRSTSVCGPWGVIKLGHDDGHDGNGNR